MTLCKHYSARAIRDRADQGVGGSAFSSRVENSEVVSMGILDQTHNDSGT